MSDRRSLGIVTSGMRPTGSFHLGNYWGALANWVTMQDEYECFFFIVDWHALTDTTETQGLAEAVHTMAVDWLACGLDPQKASIFIQSDIKELCELHLLLSMTTPVSWLERVPTYRERVTQQHIESPGYGLLGYPVLMAADILIYGGEWVPVGEDQVPHVNLTQNIAERFNGTYGHVFSVPSLYLTPTKRVPGTDWRKMSKRYGNSIEIAMTEGQTVERVRQCYTDPAKVRLSDPGHPTRTLRPRQPGDTDDDVVGRDESTTIELVVDNKGCVVYALHEIYSPGEIDTIRATCLNGQRGCVGCKEELAGRINAALRPIRERRTLLVEDRPYVERILTEGAEGARIRAQAVMKNVRRVMCMRSLAPVGAPAPSVAAVRP